MQRNNSVVLVALRAIAILFALISLIACLTGECWYAQVLPAVGFVAGLFALASLFASLCLLFASTSPNMVIITRAPVIIVVFILSLISGVLFAIGTRVCLAETFGSCYLFYYSKSFIVASVFAFLCALVCIVDLVIVLCLKFRQRSANKYDDHYIESLGRQPSDTSTIGTARPITHQIRIAEIARQHSLHTDL